MKNIQQGAKPREPMYTGPEAARMFGYVSSSALLSAMRRGLFPKADLHILAGFSTSAKKKMRYLWYKKTLDRELLKREKEKATP